MPVRTVAVEVVVVRHAVRAARTRSSPLVPRGGVVVAVTEVEMVPEAVLETVRPQPAAVLHAVTESTESASS